MKRLHGFSTTWSATRLAAWPVRTSGRGCWAWPLTRSPAPRCSLRSFARSLSRSLPSSWCGGLFSSECVTWFVTWFAIWFVTWFATWVGGPSFIHRSCLLGWAHFVQSVMSISILDLVECWEKHWQKAFSLNCSELEFISAEMLEDGFASWLSLATNWLISTVGLHRRFSRNWSCDPSGNWSISDICCITAAVVMDAAMSVAIATVLDAVYADLTGISTNTTLVRYQSVGTRYGVHIIKHAVTFLVAKIRFCFAEELAIIVSLVVEICYYQYNASGFSAVGSHLYVCTFINSISSACWLIFVYLYVGT